ncbi:related to C6 transcription factor [Cephalotrichum gorgonifer]|uniref:Related to C6 transcription factor n=1 Tax=Cephalotrichum gorgonifer TaxID=2041049 RepID=A0AAE8MX36_9PEZI|nr:related to C6 transcription factor [Cephalotrichum gorgonifer]
MPRSPLPTPYSPRTRARRRPTSRACDRCRRRKAKCDSGNQSDRCALCRDAGEQCTFDLPLARRGPKTRRTTINSGNSTALDVSVDISAGPLDAGDVPSPLSFVGTPGATGRGYGSASNSPNVPWERTSNLSVGALSPQTVRGSVPGLAPTQGISARRRWHDLSRALAVRAVDLEKMANRCFDLFFEYLFPLTPLVHEASLREGLAFFTAQNPLEMPSQGGSRAGMERAAVGASGTETWADIPEVPVPVGNGGMIVDTWPAATFTLITAVCAEAAFLLPKNLFPEGETVADAFLQASRNCLGDYLEADLEDPNANSITIRYFHSNCLHAAGKQKYSWHIFGEATRLAQVMQLHDEASMEGLFPTEAELRRRAFWIVYMGDKSAAILNNRPITIHKFSFESGITTSYPTGIEDESTLGPSPGNTDLTTETTRRSFIDGFNANLRLWQAASDLLVEIRVLQDQNKDQAGSEVQVRAGTEQAMITTDTRGRRPLLDALYIRFITCLDDLPPYLQSYTFAAIANGGTETTRSKQFIIQCANLQVSLHCLRMVIAQKFEEAAHGGLGLGLGLGAEQQADVRTTEIARDMLRVMHEAPFWSLQVNGEPYVEKIRLMGASLLAIIHRNRGSPLAVRAQGDFTVLLDILTRLDSKASDALRSNSMWVA